MKKRFDSKAHVEEKSESEHLTTADLVNFGDDPEPLHVKKDLLDHIAKVMGYIPDDTGTCEPDNSIWTTQRTGDEIIEDADINGLDLEKRAIELGAAVSIFDDHEYMLGEYLPSEAYSLIEDEVVKNKRELTINQSMQQEIARHRRVMKEFRSALETI